MFFCILFVLPVSILYIQVYYLLYCLLFCLNKVALFSPVTKHIMGIFKCCFSIYLLSAKRITFSKSETYLIDYFLE